ncbi:transglutaminase TgpA family protein [Dactylosporangium darangshiense]|uniref:Transglutaminase-like domain-containing protein n=1 Tax=Dactylosporangium darangshiense TaxID=579108 RepID=A0ABP8DST9_9ACTN
MNERARLTLIALGASALAALPLLNVFARYTWTAQTALVLALMGTAGVLTRLVRAPAWAPSAAMAASALLALLLLFPGGARHLAALLADGVAQARRFAAPVGDHDGLLLLAAAGVAALALLVDALVVQLRRPALAGLPMLAVYTVPVAVMPDSTGWAPFALGALGFVWLLVADRQAMIRRFGRRLTVDGRAADPRRPTSLAVAGRRLGFAGVALAVTLPFLVPAALTSGVLGRGGTGPGGFGGQAGPVSLLALLSGELNRGATIDLLKVTDLDDPRPHYLRLDALEQLTARGFEPLPPGAAAPLTALPRPGWGPGVPAAAHHAEIEIGDRFTADRLPIYTWPTRVGGVERDSAFDTRTQAVYSGLRTTANRRYTVDYVRAEPTPDDLRRAAAVDPSDPALRDVLAAPPNLVVRDTVRGLVEGRTTEYDKVMAVLGFFSPANHFTYDTSTGPDTGGAAITDFLRNRRGFCAQYAAAFAWLLREAGIPSRVAIGFSRGTAHQGRTTTLTNHDLHAWTEVYFPGFGWLPFDATPPGAIGGPAAQPTPAASTLPSPTPPALGAGPAALASSASRPARHEPPDGAGPATEPALLDAAPWTLGGLLLTLLALPALARARVRRRRLAVVGADARGGAHDAWDELLDVLTDYRVPVARSATPRATAEWVAAVAALGERGRDGLRALTRAEEHARYAARPLAAIDLRAAVAAVRAGLAAHASRRVRLMAVALPPSMLRRRRGRARRG